MKTARDQNRIEDRNNLISSEQWDCDHTVHSIGFDCMIFDREQRDDIKNAVKEILDNNPNTSNFGIAIIRSHLANLKRLNERIRLLSLNRDECKWGERSARSNIIKSCRTTEHCYDNRIDEQTTILNVLLSERDEAVKFIRNLANEFKIEIPLKKQLEIFDEIS